MSLQGRFQDWSQLAGESKPGRKPITPTDAEAPDILEDADAGECSVGARVGIFWADDAIFYKVSFTAVLQSAFRLSHLS